MKKVLFVMLLGCMFLGSNAFAETEEDFTVPPINPNPGGRGLVNRDVADLSAKVSELERRINDIDRDRRFNEDRIRQLDRDVSDIKRRF